VRANKFRRKPASLCSRNNNLILIINKHFSQNIERD
jgi:hypothetical protein